MGAFSNWTSLGSAPPTALGAARDVAHWAAQIVAAAATLLDPLPDSSHTALRWDDPRGALVGAPIDGVRLGLVLRETSLVVLRQDDVVFETFPLEGITLAGGLVWAAQSLSRALHRDVRALVRPDHALPDHAVGRGAPFVKPDPRALAELARWFSVASDVLDVVARTPGASPVRCWPHHFDIATLVTMETPDAHEGVEHARSIGVGLSPGDGSYAQPYFYVSPWPRPTTEPARLAVGEWHTQGWLGAVLTAERIVEAPGDERSHRVAAFVESAMKECRAMLR